MLVFGTTTDTEILALSRVARDLPAGFPTLKAVSPMRLPCDAAPETLAGGASHPPEAVALPQSCSPDSAVA